MLSVNTWRVFAGKSKQAVAVKFKGEGKKKKHLPEVIPVALRCWHENVLAVCVFIGGDKEMETKRRTAGDERHGKTLALSMHRGTIRLYGYTVNGGEPRGLSANKVIHLLIGMMEQK